MDRIFLTVRELKEYIAGFPDDARVKINIVCGEDRRGVRPIMVYDVKRMAQGSTSKNRNMFGDYVRTLELYVEEKT